MSELESVAQSGGQSFVTLAIDSVAAGGEGVGRDADGRVVFVPRTAPGDRVRARIVSTRKRWARAELVEIQQRGPGRRDPPCPLYGQCGGCALQHLDIGSQRDAKRTIIRESLKRIGGLEADLPPVSTSGAEFGYRNRVTLTLRRGPEDVRLGYHARNDPNTILDVDDCLLAETPVRKALTELRANLGLDAGLLPAGQDLKVTIRCTEDGNVGLHVRGGRSDLTGRPDTVAASVSALASYVQTCDDGTRTVLAGSESLSERWQGTRFELGPESFLQVNRDVSRSMDSTLDEWVGPRRGVRIADLYAGVGARAIRWAREGALVTAVESDPSSVASGRRAAADEGLQLEFIAARVESVPDSFANADVIVVNPPRAGLSGAVVDALLRPGAARGLAYVSCDPATLGRDLSLLASEWHPLAVRGFDAFPQTAHVETLVWMRRADKAVTTETEAA
ncbi:MAG: class I SAM-dependent RNA methyltransferase [marine benthic group bacterium]|nr:class I SAM-dependent RNA methyltransferase [Candidatus Carthagonibacter metallireducens]